MYLTGCTVAMVSFWGEKKAIACFLMSAISDNLFDTVLAWTKNAKWHLLIKEEVLINTGIRYETP